MEQKTKTRRKVSAFRFLPIPLVWIAFFLPSALSSVQAQSTLDATGGIATGEGGSVAYSVGQLFYHTYADMNDISVAEGVQQPYEISVITGLPDPGIDLDCRVYPNPARDKLVLHLQHYDTEDLQYRLYNLKGELMQVKRITADKTHINMAGLVNATYVLNIVSEQKTITSFKIIKL